MTLTVPGSAPQLQQLPIIPHRRTLNEPVGGPQPHSYFTFCGKFSTVPLKSGLFGSLGLFPYDRWSVAERLCSATLVSMNLGWLKNKVHACHHRSRDFWVNQLLRICMWRQYHHLIKWMQLVMYEVTVCYRYKFLAVILTFLKEKSRSLILSLFLKSSVDCANSSLHNLDL